MNVELIASARYLQGDGTPAASRGLPAINW